MKKIKIGISSCLLGNNVRYDGGNREDPYIKDVLGMGIEWFPVCPEVECGLGVPREAMHLVGDAHSPRLVTMLSRVDHTDVMLAWTEKRLVELGKENLNGFIFKSRSPSSGLSGVTIYTSAGVPAGEGSGIFAAAFVKRFPSIPVIDDTQFHDSRLREDFIKAIFALSRGPARGC
jgi:uncharacterized protein YbbK (DUF523 family)